MFTFLLVLISLVALLLCVIVLLQSGKGGGLAASFGGASSSTESFMGGRQAATMLTKLTWIGGGLFLFLALVLAVLSSRGSGQPESILRRETLPANQLPAPPPSVLQTESSGGTATPPSDTGQGAGEPAGAQGAEGVSAPANQKGAKADSAKGEGGGR
ncbi:MAG: preprotein translocase subunit SecG [Gemmatimonadota bacterium]